MRYDYDDLGSNLGSAWGFSTDPEAWRSDALCAQVDLELWFPEKGGSTREAKKVCHGCPVQAECLAYALERDEPFGIWGGLSYRERRKVLRGEPVEQLAPCGTVAAYQRHIRWSETPCELCREAKNRETRQYNTANADQLRARREERRRRGVA